MPLEIKITGKCGERQIVERESLGKWLMWGMGPRQQGSEMFKWE
jgi:hypothetical protein